MKMLPRLLFAAFVCLFSSAAGRLEKGEVAYKVWKMSDDVYRFYVTDGRVIIKATTSSLLDDMMSCHIYGNIRKGEKLTKSPDVTVENIGESQIKLMKQKCGLYQTRARRASNGDSDNSFNQDLVKNKPFEGDFKTGAPSGAGSHFAIFPGTKWCGYENIAQNMQDLGVHNATDACCRTHDHCPYYIDRFETKYHYFNHDPWTLSHCECDQHLFDCLKWTEEKKVEIYLTSSVEVKVLAACQDYSERQNIRSALREIKGLILDGNDIITNSFGSKSFKCLSSNTSPRKEQLPPKPSAINSDWNEKKYSNNITKRNFDINCNNDPISQEEKLHKPNNKTDKNGNQKPQFRSYLFAGTLNSPKNSPRGKKDSHNPRKVHTAITRIKVLDKSDFVDKCTETEEGVIDINKVECLASERESQKVAKFNATKRKERIKRYESTPLPRSQTKEKDPAAGLDISAIEFSGDLEKVKQTSVLHRPVSINLSSLSSDNVKPFVSQISSTISSPRKPRKIVSYRTSAFSAANKLHPVSSTISRARLQSAPPAIDKSCENLETNSKQVNGTTLDTAKEFRDFHELHKQFIETHLDTSGKLKGIQGFSKEISKRSEEIKSECTKSAEEKSADTQEFIYTAKPIEIKRETGATEESLVTRLRSKLESTKKRDFKSDIQEFNYFTNKMKEKHGRKQNTEEKHIILSPVKTYPDVQPGENEENSEINVISNYTNNKTILMDENVDKGLQKKKPGLSRKNRIDSDEYKHSRKYRKKNKDIDKKLDDQSSGVLKNVIVGSPSDQKRSLIEVSPRKGNKPGSVRRKLPEIPVKHDSEPEDDETIHQRTIRLLQERRNERREKLASEREKETAETVDKSKMSPADLKKTLELKLERSDSKRKAYRVRRELQLLNRENELKSMTANNFDADDDNIFHCDKTDNEISAILKQKVGLNPEKENEGKVVQRSKSDIVRRRRAVSETDILIIAPAESVDDEEGEKNVLKIFEIEKPLTPLVKIELIGTLMQEEAKLQEMLRKSTNFSEKRKMRAEVRHLRQKRMALEGPTGQQPVSTLRRSASVTAGVVTHATPVYITAPKTSSEQQAVEDVGQPSIEELRKKLSETQDYDEKKKIRLALRQLRQQSREGTQSALQRSQSCIHLKSSKPVTNETARNVQTVLRSQSVTEKRGQDHDTVNKDIKEDNFGVVANGDVSDHGKEKLKDSKIVAAETKPPVPKTVQRNSSFTESRWKETETISQENLHSNLVHSVAPVDKKSPKQLKVENDESCNRLKHSENERYWKKRGNVDKTEELPKDCNNDPGITHRKNSCKESGKFLTQNETSKSSGDKKPVEFLKETVSKLKSQKKKRILEKCEIFEKNGRWERDKEIKSDVKELGERSDKIKTKTPHILVSRADVERNKQNKLVSLRRDRSNSAPLIHAEYSSRGINEENKQYLNQKSDNSSSSSKSEFKGSLNTENLNRTYKANVKDNHNKHSEPNKHFDAANKKDNRLSPSLLWLEEKRKSLPLSNDIDKLMSTMDIEAAFSEILGAVEEFPEQNDTVVVQTPDIPIVEEDSCESSELEDVKKSLSNETNGENIQNIPKRKENVNSDKKINETSMGETETKLENGNEISEDGDSAIQQTSGNKNSKAKIQLCSNLSVDISSRPENNGAISVIHGDDGTVTVQEVSQVEEGDTTITEWKKLRRTQSRSEMRETDTVIEKKITSPGGSSSVYEKDVSKTKHKLTSRGSNYFTRNHYNIKRKKDLDGTEVVEHDLSSVSENMSVSKNESWADKSEAKVVLNRDPVDGLPMKLKSIEDADATEQKNGRSSPCEEFNSHQLSVVHEHLGRPSGSPEVKTTLKETSAVEGDTIILECTVVSSPWPNVCWFRGDDLLSDEDADIMMTFDSESGKASLEIHQVAVKNAGDYKCVFENPLGSASTTGRLLIKRKATGPPSFITDLADVTVCESQSLCLECQVSDTDCVTWYKDSVIQRNNTDFKQTFDGTKAKLEIVEIFLDDCGTYSCVLKNANGEKRCSCKISVTDSRSPNVVFPVFLRKPETTIANERDPVIIDCEVIGSPQPVITWYLDGTEVIEDSRHRMSYDGRVAMLVVRRVTAEDSGKIECIAENSSGKVTADCHLVIKALKTAPSITESLLDLTVASDKRTTLRCVITGQPKPEISWRKNGLIIGQMFDFKQTYEDDVAVLEISKTCVEDTGCYECIATNEKGEVSTSCQLIVKDEPVQREESVTGEMMQSKVTSHKEAIQTTTGKTFTSAFVLKGDSDQKLVAKSQASKVMLVRQGSLRSVRQEQLDKSLVRTGSLKSLDVSGKSNDSKKSNDFDSQHARNDKLPLDDDFSTGSQGKNKLLVDITDVSKGAVDVNKNFAGNLNTSIPEPIKAKSDVKVGRRTMNNEDKVRTVKTGSELSSLCLESSNVKEVKPVAKFRAGGEIRRSQSVRTPGNEKPEWLQVKLRKVGSKQSPLMLESEKLKTQSKDSPNQETVVQNETPASAHKETKLSRSQSARIVDRSLALRDSTNSPLIQPNRDSLKLTPVSERAKIFQMRDSSSSSSGKSSPVDIISKAINLSRTDSLRSPVENRSLGVQRSQSFKMEAACSQGDVTLELTPQKAQEQDSKSGSGSTRKAIKYWDPTAPSSTKMDYSTITDEEQLNQLLSKSDNFDERKKIRARIKEVREQHMKEWEAKSAARQTEHEDPIKRKHREADLMKQQKLKQFEKQAAEHHEAKHLDMAEQQLRERVRLADEEKKRTLKEYEQRGASHQESLHLEISERALQEKIKQADLLKKKTLDAYDQAAGKTDGKTVTTTRKVETVTKVGGATGKPAEEIAPQLAQKILKAAPSVSGVLTVKTESWSSKDNVTHASEKTESWGGRGGAMNAFKAMDAKNAPKTNVGAGRANITRSPSAIKTMLLDWCKAMTGEYADVIQIQNFSTSWNNGLAFCALIHHFYPDAFDIRSLDPKQRRKNFELAFDTAEKLADIAPLLDVEDMVRMQKPDWKCVFTYVQSFYRKLNAHERNKAVA